MKNLASLVLMSIATVATSFSFTACSEDPMDSNVQKPAEAPKAKSNEMNQRTVLVYMAGRNNLSQNATMDLEEMKQGSKQLSEDQALVVFMRRCYNNEEPWLARIKNGEVTEKVTVSQIGIEKDELFASDPEVMEKVMKYTFSHYPSVNDDYGLVLWGHGGGWLMQDSVVAKPRNRGFGCDVGNYIYNPNGKWINMPSLNEVLSRMPHLKFIFADCCNFMCLETLYELRRTADYVIGSPAEIPANGAPYQTVVPAMFEPTNYYHSIMERYYEHTQGSLPLSVVKTNEMENVARATKKVIDSMSKRYSEEYPDMKGMIHYNYVGEDSAFHHPYNIFYDAGDFVHHYANASEYQEWKAALDKAVIEKHIAYSWVTEKPWSIFYTDFQVSPEKYHGVSLFVPQDPSVKYGEKYDQFNQDIVRLQWFGAVSE